MTVATFPHTVRTRPGLHPAVTLLLGFMLGLAVAATVMSGSFTLDDGTAAPSIAGEDWHGNVRRSDR